MIKGKGDKFEEILSEMVRTGNQINEKDQKMVIGFKKQKQGYIEKKLD